MIKLIHIADLHLDTPFTGSGFSREQALQRRTDLRENFQRCFEIAQERKADAVLIAGDLFEEEYVSVKTFQRAMTAISGFERGPVIIAPGNHDPYHPGSLYATEELPKNLSIFKTNQIEKLRFPELKLTVYGAAFVKTHHQAELWKGFKVDQDDNTDTRIVLSHGAAYTAESGRATNYLPINVDDLKNSGADYIALGHYHRQMDIFVDPFTDSLRCAYPGSPEPLHAGSDSEHGILLITIDPVARKNTVEKLVTQRRSYRSVDLNFYHTDNIAEIDSKTVKLLQDTQYSGDMLEITLRGKVPPETVFNPGDYQNLIKSHFFVKFVNKLDPDFDYLEISKEETARGEFCRTMLGKIKHTEGNEKKSLEHALWLGLLAFDGRDVEDIPL